MAQIGGEENFREYTTLVEKLLQRKKDWRVERKAKIKTKRWIKFQSQRFTKRGGKRQRLELHREGDTRARPVVSVDGRFLPSKTLSSFSLWRKFSLREYSFHPVGRDALKKTREQWPGRAMVLSVNARYVCHKTLTRMM